MKKNFNLINTESADIRPLKVVDVYIPAREKSYLLPLFLESVSAGFPSPADDYMEGRLDLNDFLVKHPAATFFVRVTGDSMVGASINNGDILIVDRSINPEHGHIVIAVIHGELTVKRLHKSNLKIMLIPENKAYQPIEITEEMNFEVWGVVISVIHSVI
jgi:DNA polymerase V